MKFSENDIKEFQEILTREYDQKVSYSEAEQIAQNLIQVLLICIR